MRINWGAVIPVGCIIAACGIFWGKEGLGYALFGAGVLFLLGYWLGGDE